MAQNDFIAYYRVSTARQGKSGLGLEAQRSATRQSLKTGQQIIREFIEVETGKKNSRPVLQEALAYTKQVQGTLVIAKLDRLARNAAFIFALRDSGVNFICADLPEANTLTIGIFATMAQHEAEIISDRTKKALAELKRRGAILGKPENLTQGARLKGAAMMKEKAKLNDNNRRAAAMIRSLRTAGQSWAKIAEQLNSSGFTTRRGKRFQIIQVQRLVN